ncbi:uncharacterized protein LOC125679949 isoform X2 [Ostrea edulis]|uniref:uncharacterized protein LOC125679949 isoform X2 n=1 Tax=Ostrea edulis TaxID=37623 RepID=UPI0024AF83FC|nr:uncharacterized protein LOC125679949 isoform X2 [Ostrea edulis]
MSISVISEAIFVTCRVVYRTESASGFIFSSSMAKVNLFCKHIWRCLPQKTKMMCAVPLLTATGVVYAGKAESEEKKLVKVSEISMYNNPEGENKYYLKEEKYETLRDYVNSARVSFNEFMEPQWDRIEDVKDKVAIGKAHSAALVERLRTDKELQRKITIVGGSSLGAAGVGLSIVERGKKGTALTVLFGLLGGTIAMVVLHPNQTLALIGFSPDDVEKKDSKKD